MRLFGNKGVLTSDEPNQDGKVLVRITIDKVERQTRKVRVIVVERSTGKTIYKLRYTSNKKDIPCYYEAENYVKQYVKDHDFIIDSISSNVQLPVVRNGNKHSR
jgi:hypothetical protein